MPFVDDPNKKGDLVVEFDIEFPKSLNSQSKDYIKRALIPGAFKHEERAKLKKQALDKSSDFD